jgi:hypothetical protein
VLVVRAEDVAFALDPMIAPKDARDMVDVALEGIVEQLVQKRLEGKSRAKKVQGAGV